MTTTDRAVRAGTRAVPASGLVVLALCIVYVVWGSTYLAIRILVQEAPPLTAMGVRYVIAGTLLGAILIARGGLHRLALTRKQALGTAFLSLMLPLMGNGMVSVGENLGAPSGVAALLIAVTPLLIVVFRAAEGDRPPVRTVIGVLLGFSGLVYLILAGRNDDGSPELHLGAALLILLAATCWAIGSYVQPRLWLPRDVFVIAVYEMLFGGVLLLGAGRLARESFTADYSARTWFALAYLIVFGSVIAFTSYVWLVSSAPISLVSTYAYVNPVVAVFLGWLVLSEQVTMAVLIGGGVVVAAVAVTISGERPHHKREAALAAAGEPSPPDD